MQIEYIPYIGIHAIATYRFHRPATDREAYSRVLVCAAKLLKRPAENSNGFNADFVFALSCQRGRLRHVLVLKWNSPFLVIMLLGLESLEYLHRQIKQRQNQPITICAVPITYSVSTVI